MQDSYLSLTICLRFLWSGFSENMEEKGREEVLAWLLTALRRLTIGFWPVPSGDFAPS